MTALALGLLMLRLGAGLTVAAHGAQKLLGWFGGSGLKKTTAGFARQRAMLVAIASTHFHKGFWNRNGGMEFPLMIAIMAFTLALTGAGDFSLDTLFKIALPEPITWIALALGTIVTVGSALQSRTLASRAASQTVGTVA